MGVHGLWELLAPVGRRVSVETLAGKTLAVDASIWMVQFMKAMRDEKGEMVRNAHLLGFFRRICKLLFLRTKPVFVFDGGTPALKRRTVIARRRQRENAQAKVRKTAEKLLLNHLKALRLKELADDIKNHRLKQKNDTKGSKKPGLMQSVDNDLGTSNVKDQNEMSAAKFAATEEIDLLQEKRSSRNQEELDEMLAASIAVEENGILAGKEVASTVINTSEDDCDADLEMMLPSSNADIDLAVLAALPQSMQHDILAQLKGKKTEAPLKDVENQKQHEENKDKGKGIMFTETEVSGCSSRCDIVSSRNEDQDKIDEMLAACIAEEENTKSLNNASTSLGASTFEEEDVDYEEDEEMILPAMHGEVDPAVLASLPPSMQLDLLVQMRERLIAENRQKYQKVKKDPAKFSELQIQAYLKTVAFRRDIDEVQKAAAGKGVGGVQTSRIASEANREYIFSSSFTGDKQELTSTRMDKNDDTHQKAQGTHPTENFTNNITVGNDSDASRGLVCNEHSESADEGIQTYLDERGRFRVSRLRAMGMRMTNDIQRNLDLMKEIEQERTYVTKAANIGAVLCAENPGPSESSGSKLISKTQEMNVDSVSESIKNERSILDGDTSIEISFEYDSKNMIADGEDDIFASLVGGNLQALFYSDATASKEKHSDLDCVWVEEVVEAQTTIAPGDKVEWKSAVVEHDNNDESEVDWEEGDCDGAKNILCHPYESAKETSQGHLEEESNLQEAIRRSLESIGDGNHKCMSSIDEHSNAKNKLDHGLIHGDDLTFSGSKDLNDKYAFLNNKNSMGDSTLHREGSIEQTKLHENLDGDGRYDKVARNISQTYHFPGSQSKSYVASISNNLEILINKPCIQDRCAHSEYSTSDTNVMMKDNVDMVAEKLLDKHRNDDKMFFDGNNSSKVVPLVVTREEKTNNHYESEPLSNSTNNTKSSMPLLESSLTRSTENLDNEPKIAAMDNVGNFSRERISNLSNDAVNTSGDFAADVAEVDLEEEMRKLGQEYINLESEQRKFQRNAESANSELFTECQELLQMFGLPYIIAPMEAEAQCAFLEHAKLVDGVVTDDSDVFLFGARSVYKNIFDDRKYVETYFMQDIEKELGLTREKLIRMALLLGSDYTEGVSGIGIVNAIEVVNAFPEDDGLLKFRQWVESPDPTILGRLNANSGSNTRKKGSKVEDKINESNHNIENPLSEQITNEITNHQERMASPDYNLEIKQTFFEKHRNVSKNWHIPSSFPCEMVLSAYYSPQVDKSTQPFTWGKPDHLVLCNLCWGKFGWSSQKADELLLPVLKEYTKHETQLRLEAFYSFNERFAKIRSKRIKKAVKGITGKQPSELVDDSKSMKSGGVSPVEPADNNLHNLKGKDGSLEGRKKPKVKQSRKRKNEGDTVDKSPSMRKKITASLAPSTSGLENLQPSKQTEKDQYDGKALIGISSGRGRGLGVKKGREKECFISLSCETSSGSSDTDDHGPRVHDDVSKVPQEVRRSVRSRKSVNYFESTEVEDSNDSFDLYNQTSLCQEPIEQNSSYIRGAHRDVATDCMDAGETSHPGTDNPDITTNAGASEDYLKMGGGFCLDDTDVHDKHNETYGVDNAMVDDTDDYPHCSVMLDVTDCDKNSSDILFSGTEKAVNEMQEGRSVCEVNKEPNLQNTSYDQSEMDVVAPENADHNSERYTGAFKAMPFLRKRKKN